MGSLEVEGVGGFDVLALGVEALGQRLRIKGRSLGQTRFSDTQRRRLGPRLLVVLRPVRS